MPTPTETPFLVRISNRLPLVEKVLILTLAFGMVLTFMKSP